MVAVDTNIIIRLLTGDNPQQYSASLKLFKGQQIFIPNTVILETEWVLRFVYEFTPKQICAAFRQLFGLSNVHLDHAHLVAQVIDWHEQGLDFADAFHLAQSQDQASFKTFDEKLMKNTKNLSKCQVNQP